MDTKVKGDNNHIDTSISPFEYKSTFQFPLTVNDE